MNILQNKKLLSLAVLAVLCSVILAFLAFRPQTSTQPLPNIPKTSALSGVKADFVTRNLIVGQTKEQEIKKLPNIKKIESSDSGETKIFLKTERALRDDLVETKNGVVTFERKVTDSRDPNQPVLSEFLKQYGNPEQIKVGSRHYGDSEKTYIFAKYGLALLVDLYGNYIDEIQHFSPMSADEYLSAWGSDVYKNTSPEPSE